MLSMMRMGYKKYQTLFHYTEKRIPTHYTQSNALNDLIRELNGGKLDKTFPIEWENYKNCLHINK